MKGAFQKVKKEDATGTKRYFRSKRTAGLNGHAANERGSHAQPQLPALFLSASESGSLEFLFWGSWFTHLYRFMTLAVPNFIF